MTVQSVKDRGRDGVNWHSRAHSQFSRHLAQFSLLRDDSDLNATYAPTLYYYRVSPDKMSFFKPYMYLDGLKGSQFTLNTMILIEIWVYYEKP